MVSRAYSVAFQGVEARMVEVQCAVTTGLPAFSIVGLPDKAVSEARDRVRTALSSMAIALPSKRITVNLSPADLPKEGSHFDLPVAMALLAALDILPDDVTQNIVALGELSLDGTLVPVVGALPAAMAAAEHNRGLLCPAGSGAEAAWVGTTQVIAAATLGDVVRHYTGQNPLRPAEPGEVPDAPQGRDLRDVKGQERAKRALEIAAAGRHHLMFVGTPGSGKSMLAARLPSILPPLTPAEALETSMIHSLAGLLDEGGISRARPFREPHHTASMAAIIGGGRQAKPGEVSLAHNGVLFMDEFPEFPRTVLETLRQPIETGEVMIARANAHVKYPCRFMLVAAANPCKCGYLSDPDRACARVPHCGEDYLGRISGPLMDRFDLRVDVPPVAFTDLDLPAGGDSSVEVAARVAQARGVQATRYKDMDAMRVNADAEGDQLEKIATPDSEARALLVKAAERFNLSARGYHRVIRVARTIADLEGSDTVRKPHIAEAISFRLAGPAVS
ncbi:YifB family Mg chelatase-like AAA ATPase [Sulfitobacter mediterraneus]|uniref:YifB family Mg chelatase-like AAA ATPase n=1 Tax=Sulfitobacter mediterraneus TaxID=83219 RepID=UPI0019333DB4|nr:YifB family Mg chelatase-like AAA ATPase [Sulfitobacter mediterraneus]MBM1634228.1 YifB family Mg chelatase-like AAA ATPase [Sulfitobacter mediterraneus]MBM1642045.1 YifB family Mg chelatase-like AAA ATPase [Sulfitobacter mediterraneus]MBM1646094.1 YifB family Mg chelatase-like AAA ATPase [Sulfitobacter mediterraneus]MBM1650140.1 YifB family Mg chelatase-like AAA ATPase [Sulfitobacter mediterraneus]MBM1654162.1 YifB family Mg chelatase-like AAA ATPase [Sulfitobacter mediterraneus]